MRSDVERERKSLAKCSLDCPAEGRRVDRWKSIQLGLDPGEVVERTMAINKSPTHHLIDVGKVLPMPALDFGQRLGVEIEMEDVGSPSPDDESPPIFPARRNGNEVEGRRQLDIHLKRFLELGDRPQNGVVLGPHDEIYVNGGLPPPEQHRRCSTHEVDAEIDPRGATERFHEPLNALAIG
jgi:hypothetical protein